VAIAAHHLGLGLNRGHVRLSGGNITILFHPNPIRSECKIEFYNFDHPCHDSSTYRMPGILARQKTSHDSAPVRGYHNQNKTLPDQRLVIFGTRGSAGDVSWQT
jgi:hypothetical protein